MKLGVHRFVPLPLVLHHPDLMHSGRFATSTKRLEEAVMHSKGDFESCVWQAGPSCCRLCKPWAAVQCSGASGLLPCSIRLRPTQAKRTEECVRLVHGGNWHLGEDRSSLSQARCVGLCGSVWVCVTQVLVAHILVAQATRMRLPYHRLTLQ